MEKNEKGNAVEENTAKKEGSPSKSQGRIKMNRTTTLVSLLVVILIAAGVGLVYMFINVRDTQNELDKYSDPTKYDELQQEQTQAVIDSVAKHLLLTEDEEPMVATIVDVDALKEQNPEFYKYAKNDDSILIYSTRAIIYRSSTDMIINVAPVMSIPQEETSQEEVLLDVDILNGSNTVDAPDTIEASVKKVNSKYTVSKLGVAERDYDSTTVYDLTGGEKADTVKALAEGLGYKYSTATPDDVETDAEVLIVAGSDKF